MKKKEEEEEENKFIVQGGGRFESFISILFKLFNHPRQNHWLDTVCTQNHTKTSEFAVSEWMTSITTRART